MLETEKSKHYVEWDGEDFRGEKVRPLVHKFVCEHAKVYDYLKNSPKSTINTYAFFLKQFCEFAQVSPEEFLKLDKKKARNLAWKYIDTIRMDHPSTARMTQAAIKKFYLYHNEEPLVFIPGKHMITLEPKREKALMTKEVCWKIISKARSKRDDALLTCAFESGLRQNALLHMTLNHFNSFEWFKKTEFGEVVRSNRVNGNIAVFRVQARKSEDHTHDNKLRGRGIGWYFGLLHEEATTSLKKYVAASHADSEPETPLWFTINNQKEKRCLSARTVLAMIKTCIGHAGLPKAQINFHAMRRAFRSVLRNTSGIDAEFKEAIMGHKLKGAQEAYFDKDPLEFARQYAKCDFSRSHPKLEKEVRTRDRALDIVVERLLKKERELKRIEQQSGT
ncbi:MAG: tyrosine-type recombinase/integrase [Candidatus Bathyarchaeota archaeon]